MNAPTSAKAGLPPIGTRVRMTSENSNWNVGELGTVTGRFDGGTGTLDWVGVTFDGREDDYTAFPDDFEALAGEGRAEA